MHLCAEVYRIPYTEWLKWDEGDRQKAIAWELRKRETCPSCGTRDEEWQTGERSYKPVHRQCIGCRELSRSNETIAEKARKWTSAVLVKVGGKRGQ